MDSRELFDIYSPFDRAQSDKIMAAVLQWVGRAVPVEYVYSHDQMVAWALRNGYERTDTAALVALLKECQGYVVRNTPLSLAINDALAARRSLYG